MISQLFILAPRGDTIVKKEFRFDVPKNTPETFFRAARFGTGRDDDEKAQAVFHEGGVNYMHVKASGLFVVATTRRNESPSLILELLHRVARVIKDYCGVLSEDALRKNAILVYELLDEMLDYGYAQSTNTESLKTRVHNEPVAVVLGTAPTHPQSSPIGANRKANTSSMQQHALSHTDTMVGQVLSSAMSALGTGSSNTKIRNLGTAHARVSADATQRSVLGTGASGSSSLNGATDRDEIFVDVVEKLNVTFSGAGHVIHQDIDGQIRVRNFLHGEPSIKIALCEDLVISGRPGGGGGGDYASCVLDDCNFHESADLTGFDADRVLSLTNVPRGEFSLMNYRSSCDFEPPFIVQTTFETNTPYQINCEIVVRAQFSAKMHCAGLAVKFPVPKSKNVIAATATVEKTAPPGSQHAVFHPVEKHVVWQLKKVTGGKTHVLRVSIATKDERVDSSSKKECGPVSLGFSVPQLNCSKLQVRYLQIGKTGPERKEKKKAANDGPHRWVRYVTKSNNFVARV